MKSLLLCSFFFSALYQQSVEGVEQGLTLSATQQGSWNQGVRIGKSMLRVVFFAALTLASLASELTVKGFKLQLFRCQLVLVAFDGLLHELGIHFYERHVATVSHPG